MWAISPVQDRLDVSLGGVEVVAGAVVAMDQAELSAPAAAGGVAAQRTAASATGLGWQLVGGDHPAQ